MIQRQLGDRSREAVAIGLAGQAYQQLDRHDDAARFHRQAANAHRELGDQWQLATTLAHLASALDHTGEHHQARTCRQEAVTLLAGFGDPPATDLHRRLTRMLTPQ